MCQEISYRAQKAVAVVGLCFCFLIFQMVSIIVKGALAESQSSSYESAPAAQNVIPEATIHDFLSYGELCQDDNTCVDLEASLKKAIESDPRNYDACLKLGIIYLNQNKLSSAEEQFINSMASRKRKRASCLWLGQCYVRQGRFDEAEAYLVKAIVLAPRDYLGYIALGQCFEAQGKCALAAGTFEKALRLADPYSVCGDGGFYVWERLIRNRVCARKIKRTGQSISNQ